jgi:hypothetical protein
MPQRVDLGVDAAQSSWRRGADTVPTTPLPSSGFHTSGLRAWGDFSLHKWATMALERKDIRAKLDADMHAQLKAICEVEDVDMGDFIERELLPVIKKRVHDAMVLAGKLQRSGITGSAHRPAGKPGTARE